MGRKSPDNWTKEMKIVLLEFLIKHKDHIHGNFSPERTAKSKAALWNEIHVVLVSMGYDGGLVKLKKHYNNLVTRTKIKIDGASKTGSGKPEELDELDEMVIATRDPSVFFKNGVPDPLVTFGSRPNPTSSTIPATSTTPTTSTTSTTSTTTSTITTSSASIMSDLNTTVHSPLNNDADDDGNEEEDDEEEVEEESFFDRTLAQFVPSTTTTAASTTTTTTTTTTTLSSELGTRRRRQPEIPIDFETFLRESNNNNNNSARHKSNANYGNLVYD